MLWTLDPAERDAYLAKESTKMFTKNNWVLVEIACTRSAVELFKVKQAYQARYKKSLEEDVAQHTSGDLRKLLLPLVSTFRYEGDDVNMMLARSEAKLLHEKVSEKAFNDDDFIRILTTRSKAQLGATLNHYNNEHGNSINKVTTSTTLQCCPVFRFGSVRFGNSTFFDIFYKSQFIYKN